MPGSVIVGSARTPIGKLSSSLKRSFLGPEAKWLPIPEVYVPGSPDVAGHIMKETVSAGFDPALSYDLKLDRGFMTVYYQLESMVSLPMVPIVLNCATITTPPLMTLRHADDFGAAVGDAIRSFDGLERVAVIAGGGLSHFFGEPRGGGGGGVGGVGGVDEEFDRWFLRRLESRDDAVLFALPDDELMEVGHGTGEVRAWMAVAGSARGSMRGAMWWARAEVLAYEPSYRSINGMGVVLFDRARD